jgi:DGQHR domain-containing protein
MNSARLRQICYVTPRSQDNPEEIQRILDERRAREIGNYIMKSTTLLPNAIVVSLTEDVRIERTATDDTKILHFPSEEGKFAYILDGQHRLAGFRHSEGVEFDLPVVAIYKADHALRGKTFADINSKQVRVSDVHLLALYYQIRDLPVDESSVMDVIARLNSDVDSPLRSRIKMMDTDRGPG